MRNKTEFPISYILIIIVLCIVTLYAVSQVQSSSPEAEEVKQEMILKNITMTVVFLGLGLVATCGMLLGSIQEAAVVAPNIMRLYERLRKCIN